MRTTFIEIVAGAALAASVGAFAQMTPPPSATSSPSPSASSSVDSFSKLDADHDGTISKKEAAKNKDLVAKFDTLDSNKDGKLDQGEFAAFEASDASPKDAAPSSKPKY